MCYIVTASEMTHLRIHIHHNNLPSCPINIYSRLVPEYVESSPRFAIAHHLIVAQHIVCFLGWATARPGNMGEHYIETFLNNITIFQRLYKKHFKHYDNLLYLSRNLYLKSLSLMF